MRLGRIIPAEMFDGCLASFSSIKPTTFRVNTLIGDIAQTRAELVDDGFDLEPIHWFEDTFIVDDRQRRALTETAAFHEGRIYIQNLSSMVAPMVLAPQPGETILDLAAAPGGKTLQIAAMMNGEGRLVAVDAVKNRYHRLKANLARGGASKVETYLMDGRFAGRRWPELFDRVLLDAPCSSEARFTRLDSQSWNHWSIRKIKECAYKQKGLLRAALQALKPGGELVYCTCSFSPEENELVIESQLRHYHGALEILSIEAPVPNVVAGLTLWGKRGLPTEMSRTVRILPDEMMDGFFICKITKKQSILATF